MYGWQAVLCRKVREPSQVPAEYRHASVSAHSGRLLEGLVPVAGALHLQRMKLDSQMPRRELYFLPGKCRDELPRIPEHGYARDPGDSLFEERQQFSSRFEGNEG